MKSWSIPLLCLLLLTAAAKPMQGRVVEVIDGDTFVLDSGEHVRLLGIQAPEIAHDEQPAQPFSAEARERLTELAKGKAVTLSFDRQKRDRYKRLLAVVTLPDGSRAQDRLLEEGLAYVYSFPDNPDIATSLYPFEEKARKAKRGGWKADWTIYPAAAAEPAIGRYAFVEGVVKGASKVKDQIYLNFGSDWRTDFTLFISRKHRKIFGDEWKKLAGKKLLVRGWVLDRHGPAISLTHPQQYWLEE